MDDQREAILLSQHIYRALRPAFMALLIEMMRVAQASKDPNAKPLPDLEYQRQADALLLDAEQFHRP